MVQTQDPLRRGHFGFLDLHLKKFGKEQLGNFKHLSPVVLKKKISENNQMYSDDRCISMLKTKIPLGWGHLDPETFILINLVNDHWTMLLHTKFQASEVAGSDLKIF